MMSVEVIAALKVVHFIIRNQDDQSNLIGYGLQFIRASYLNDRTYELGLTNIPNSPSPFKRPIGILADISEIVFNS
jgi:hypothetical protein